MKKDYARIRSRETGKITKVYKEKRYILSSGIFEMLDPLPEGCELIGFRDGQAVKVTKK